VILAPADPDPALSVAVQTLRRAGERVVCALPGQAGTAADMGCERTLVRDNGAWVVRRTDG
jgi:ATP phosphoribosyltransferase regulatory subunit